MREGGANRGGGRRENMCEKVRGGPVLVCVCAHEFTHSYTRIYVHTDVRSHTHMHAHTHVNKVSTHIDRYGYYIDIDIGIER